jgi:hypothetical protein
MCIYSVRRHWVCSTSQRVQNYEVRFNYALTHKSAQPGSIIQCDNFVTQGHAPPPRQTRSPQINILTQALAASPIHFGIMHNKVCFKDIYTVLRRL